MIITEKDKSFLRALKSQGVPADEAIRKLKSYKSSETETHVPSPTDVPEVKSFLEGKIGESINPIGTAIGGVGKMLSKGYDDVMKGFNQQEEVDKANPMAAAQRLAEDSQKNAMFPGLGGAAVMNTAQQGGGQIITGASQIGQGDFEGGASNILGGATAIATAPVSGATKILPKEGQAALGAVSNIPAQVGKDFVLQVAKTVDPNIDENSPEWKKHLDLVGNIVNAAMTAKGFTKGEKIAHKGQEVVDSIGKKVEEKLSPTAPARVDRVVKNRVAELQKLQDNNSQIRKAINSAEKKGIDVKGELAKTDLLKGAVDGDGTIRTQDAIDQINEFIRPQEDVIGQNLRKEGGVIPLTEVEARLKSAVQKSGKKGGALVRALKNVDSDIEGYKLEADADGNIPVATLHDAKVDKYSNIDYLNPESSVVDKVIAKELKKIVEDKSKVNVAELNKELSKYYSMQNLLEKLNGKKVAGGRLGKYFAQTVGGMFGNAVGAAVGGPVGQMIGIPLGGKVGESLQGAQMASKFGGRTGYQLKPSEAMTKAMGK